MNQRGEVGEESSEAAPESNSEESSESEENSEESSEDSGESITEENSEESSGEAVEVQAENEQELEQEIQEAIQEGASEEEVKDMIRQYTLKVDGKEFIKEVDLNNEEELIKQFQLAAKGQKSMQELQELKRVYSEELNNIMSDPFKTLQRLNPDFDPIEAAGQYLDKVIQEQQMDPEEKLRLERQDELDKITQERDALREAAAKRKQDEEYAQIAAEIESDIMSALDQDSDLLADRETVALVADQLHWAAKNKIDVSAKDVLPTVKAQLKRQFERSASRFKSTASLKQYMGAELIDKLREERVQQASKVVKNTSDIKSVAKPENKVKEERPKIKLSSLFDR